MKGLPWWFQTVSHVLAVVFSMWVGLHIYAPLEWLVLFGLAAVVAAALPYSRTFGLVGLIVSLAFAGLAGYLTHDMWPELSATALIDPKGGPLGGGRDLVMLGIAAVWMLGGSAFRMTRA